MAKKTKIDIDKLQKDAKESANRIWLAGLGALSTAEKEGSKVFKELVKKGEAYEKKARTQLKDLRGSVESAAGKAKDTAVTAWDKVEGAWDDRVAATLRRIGVPSKEEISRLTHRVEELTALVEGKAKPKRARKTAAPRKVAKKAAKKTPRKAAAKRKAPTPSSAS